MLFREPESFSPPGFSPAAFVVAFSAASSAMTAWRCRKDEVEQQRQRLRSAMASSKSYFEWSIAATKLDALNGTNQEARWRKETMLYDRRLLEDKLAHLRAVRSSGSSILEQMFSIRADLLRNLGNITNSALHDHFPVVPEPIRDYIDELKDQLQEITCSPEIPLEDRVAFLKETRHAFGRTALILSGGGPLGPFHLGVVKALVEHRLLPRVIAGTSIGAVVAAIAATRDDVSLTAFLESLSQMDLLFFCQDQVSTGFSNAFSTTKERQSPLLKRNPTRVLRRLLGDITFLQAYALTGRVLNISVSTLGSADPPRLLNYLTAPDVLIWSAVTAAAGFAQIGRHRQSVKGATLFARDTEGRIIRFPTQERVTSSTLLSDGKACARYEYDTGNSGRDIFGRGSSKESGDPSKGPVAWQSLHLVVPADDIPLRGLSETFSVNHTVVSQTDPQLVPLLSIKKQLGTMGQLLEAEIKHRCMQALEILPGRGRVRWLRRMAQPWEGDVTIVPPNVVLQVQRSLTGSTQGDALDAVRAGELATWRKLSGIQCNCGIEVALDGCIQQACAWKRRYNTSDSSPLKGLHADACGKGKSIEGVVEDGSGKPIISSRRWNLLQSKQTSVHDENEDDVGSGPQVMGEESSVIRSRSCGNLSPVVIDDGKSNMDFISDGAIFSPRESALLIPYGRMRSENRTGGQISTLTSFDLPVLKDARKTCAKKASNRTNQSSAYPLEESLLDCIDISANPFHNKEIRDDFDTRCPDTISEQESHKDATTVFRRSLDCIAP